MYARKALYEFFSTTEARGNKAKTVMSSKMKPKVQIVNFIARELTLLLLLFLQDNP